MTDKLIKPMINTLVRDAICQLVADKRDEQIKFARDMGLDDDFISENMDFTVFPKRFRSPSVQDMPCIYIYFNVLDFPIDGQESNTNYANANFVAELYCYGENTQEHTADENAENRLSYLLSQLYHILFKENAIFSATNKIVNHYQLKQIRRILLPEELNQASSVMGLSVEFELGFSEPTDYADLSEINEFYIKLNINDEFIDPFIRVLLNSLKIERR